MALNYQARPYGAVIRHIVIHTNQGPHLPNQHPDHSAEALASYLTSTADTSDPVSYHVVVDDDSLIEYLPDNMESWSAFSANPIGLHLCFVGLAEWQRSDWLNHKPMLQLAAKKVLQWSILHQIPITKRSPKEVANEAWGLIGHGDWTYAQKMINPKAPDSHTDPGPNFPWDVFVLMVYQLLDQQNQGTSIDMAINNYEIPPNIDRTKNEIFVIGCPVGKTSVIVKQAWISTFLTGPTTQGFIHFWFQNDNGGISDRSFTLNFKDGHSTRFWSIVPDGTTMIRCEYNFPDGGIITLETEPK